MNDPAEQEEQYVKILIYLEKDEDGYPPEEVESLWAVALPDGTYRLDNIPFFARSLACEDIVSATPDADGMLVYDDLVAEGGHSTVRVLCRDTEEEAKARQELVVMGCSLEGAGIRGLFSVDVPPEVSYRAVFDHLARGSEAGRWDFEEACIASTAKRDEAR